MKLYLITEGFPYNDFERPFISPELEILKDYYDIHIVACTNSMKLIRDEDEELDKCNIRYEWVETGFSGFGIKSFALAVKYLIASLCYRKFWKELGILFHKKRTFRPFKDIVFFTMCSLRYRDVLNKKIDNNSIIYTFWNNTFTLAALEMKESKSLKVISRIHGYDLYEHRSPNGIWQPYKNQMDNDIDVLLFISKQGLDYYESTYRCLEGAAKHIVSYLGIKPKGVVNNISEPHTFTLVSCSSVIPLKRVDLIVKALSQLEDKYRINWIHFGNGTEFEQLKLISSQLLDMKNNISYELRGFVSNDFVIEYYEKHPVDCMILLSETEGLPVSIMEAISFGIPIIATDVGGIREEVEGNGVLIDPRADVSEVCQAIREIYDMSAGQIKEIREKSYHIWQTKFDCYQNTGKLLGIINAYVE